jgi:hypothetical protein
VRRVPHADGAGIAPAGVYGEVEDVVVECRIGLGVVVVVPAGDARVQDGLGPGGISEAGTTVAQFQDHAGRALADEVAPPWPSPRQTCSWAASSSCFFHCVICPGLADNQVRLQLFALAYNLGNFLRRLALPRGVKHWTLTTLRDKLIKIGAKVVHHAWRVVFQMAEVAIPRPRFAAILRRIERLRLLAPAPT